MTTRKVYSKEFKLDAISLVLEQDYDRTEAARSLGINANMLGRWVKEHQTDIGVGFLLSLWVVGIFSQAPCRIHSLMENANDLDTVPIGSEDDDMTLMVIAEEALSEFRAFVPERLIAAQPLQACRNPGSITASLLVVPVFPCVATDLGEISKRWPCQPILHYPVGTELSAPTIIRSTNASRSFSSMSITSPWSLASSPL